MVQEIADFFYALRQAEESKGLLPDELRPVSLADGYAAQEILVEKLLAQRGGASIGYKIACTSEHAQGLLGTDGPVYGRLFSATTWPSGTALSASRFPMLIAEAEFAFIMAADADPRGAPWTRDTIADRIGSMLPTIELVGHRLRDWSEYGAEALAADNAIHEGWVVGEPTEAWREHDLAALEVRVLADGAVRRSGCGANVLGHPLNAMAWLANELIAQGRTLRAGDRVTTGVATDVYPSAPGEQVRADFGPLGACETRFCD